MSELKTMAELRGMIAEARANHKPDKKVMGRPTKYCPEFCEIVIELGKLGKSIAQMASAFEVDKASIYDWAAAHEDFSTSLTRARSEAQAWWEDHGQTGLYSREFNANLWIKSVASRFRDDYTERKETQLTGADGGPVQVQSQVVDAKTLDADQREALRAILMAAKEGTR
jgi:hypothetical protein